MEQDLELNPELWQNLANDLVAIIVEKVLIGLPFSRVLRFCFLSKRSRAFLLSTQYLLYFNNLDECTIFNPRTGLWEAMSLPLSQTEALTLQHMELVCCDEGLLYFASATRDEFILYNLLTGKCGESQRPSNAAQVIDNAQREAHHKVGKSYPSAWHVLRCASPWSIVTPAIIVGIDAHDSNTGFFELLVVRERRNGNLFEGVILKDSRRGGWVRGPEVKREFHSLAFPTVCRAAREILLGFEPSSSNSFDLLLYDVPEQTCRWRHVLSLAELVNVRMEKKILATVSGGGELEFLEFFDRGVRLVKAASPPPPVVLRANATFSFVQMISKDIMYYIWLFRHEPEGQARGLVNIGVRTHHSVNGIERISDWMECRPSGLRPFRLPSSRNFHVVRPTLFWSI